MEKIGEAVFPELIGLAIAHWHLNDEEKAREYYTKASDQKERWQRGDPVLTTLFYGEASKLFGPTSGSATRAPEKLGK